MAPRSCGVPGNVMSTLESDAISVRSRNSAARISSAGVMEFRASLSSLPTTGFSSFENDFILSLQAVMLPFLPRNFTRAASRDFSSVASAISRNASARNSSSGCVIGINVNGERATFNALLDCKAGAPPAPQIRYAAFFAFGFSLDFFSSADFTCSMMSLKAASSFMQRSERIFRSRPIPEAFKPSAKRL